MVVTERKPYAQLSTPKQSMTQALAIATLHPSVNWRWLLKPIRGKLLPGKWI